MLNALNMILCLSLFGATGCGWFKTDNKPSTSDRIKALEDRDAKYCALSKPIYEAYENTIEPACDAALFTGLHGLKCGYVTVSQFESVTEPGKLCRRPGCTCFPKQVGLPSSDSGFSKDMATGMQVYLSAKPDKVFAQRIQDYGISKNWTVCNAETAADVLGKCLMSSKIVYRWAEIEKKGAAQELSGPEDEPKDDETGQGNKLTGNTDFRAHLDILSIVTEFQLYGGISDGSVKTIIDQSKREPNNLLYQAMASRFAGGNVGEVAEKLLAKFPSDRLPTSDDWCTPYLYQRDERGGSNPDWLPCPERKETHPGTDYLFASWVLQMK